MVVAICHAERMDVEWVAVVLVLAGFLGSLINALWARRERIAAGESADMAREVQESMADSQAKIATALSRPDVAFEVVEHGKFWLLRNKGRATATGLVINWPALCHPIGDVPDTLEPGIGVVFGLAPRRVGAELVSTMRVSCEQLPDGVPVSVPVR